MNRTDVIGEAKFRVGEAYINECSKLLQSQKRTRSDKSKLLANGTNISAYAIPHYGGRTETGGKGGEGGRRGG